MLHLLQCSLVATAQSLTAICNPTLSPHTHRDGYGHVRGIWDRLHPAKKLRRANSDISNARGTSNGTLHARLTTKTCTTLFADRNQRLDIMPPNALHRSVSYRMCSRETRVISPGPIANGLTQCRPPVAFSSNSSRSTLRGRSARQQKISPVENSPRGK